MGENEAQKKVDVTYLFSAGLMRGKNQGSTTYEMLTSHQYVGEPPPRKDQMLLYENLEYLPTFFAVFDIIAAKNLVKF